MKILCPVMLIILFSCHTSNTMKSAPIMQENEFSPVFQSGPQLLVYKTKGNYNNLVPVMLSEDRTQIVSYPHPKDLITGSGFPIPMNLNDGYLLDNRGIGKNVAFLNITYKEYSQLKEVPLLKELYKRIIDTDPLIELCNCGLKKETIRQTSQLNKLIDKKKLRTICKPIL